MKFFELYGTHYIVKIVLGGKIVIDENLSSGSSSDSKNLDLNLGVLRYLDKSSNSKNSNLNDRNISIFGGTVWDDNWYNELKTDPAPLKFTLATYNEIFKEYNINYKHYINTLKKHLKVR
uniref:MAC/Perforin domain containing protein, putative n=1 Tax=Theileria annulata TaxID=5874 RepID=A0A3B0NAP8_THEAN